MYGYIYKTTNLINNKFYIGQKKSNVFLKEKYLGSGTRLHSAIEHYGKENFKVELIDTAESKEELDDKEIYWIDRLDARNLDIAYNLSKGGDGNSSGIAWNKGLTKELNPKLEQSQETKDKRSNSLKKAYAEGRHVTNLSESARNIMSEKAKLRPHPPTTANKKCYTDGKINRMLLPEEIDDYIAKGFYKGKTVEKRPAWNKGLTAETDERVKAYSDKRKELVKSGKSVGFVNCPGNHFSKGQKVEDYNIQNS